MDTIRGEFIVVDHALQDSRKTNYKFDTLDYQLYEVMRVIDGKVLFLEDHIERLENGLESLGFMPGNFANEVNEELLIQVDGGVSSKNIKHVVGCGANVIVAGSAVFKNGEIEKNIKELKDSI